MTLRGTFKFMGVEVRPGFKDPNKINYVLGLCQGMDTLRLYIEPGQYQQFANDMQSGNIQPYCDLVVDLDFNPVAQSVSYCMHLVNYKIKEVK